MPIPSHIRTFPPASSTLLFLQGASEAITTNHPSMRDPLSNAVAMSHLSPPLPQQMSHFVVSVAAEEVRYEPSPRDGLFVGDRSPSLSLGTAAPPPTRTADSVSAPAVFAQLVGSGSRLLGSDGA